MAKLEGNVFGGFSGRLGNVVGYSRNGEWFVRQKPISVRNPRTEAQQKHRSMFAEEVRLAGRMSWGIGVGLKSIAEKFHMTVQNAFVSLNQQSFSLSDGAFEVDWSQLMISGGPVAPVELTETAVNEDNVLNIKFNSDHLATNANRFDNIYLYVYCPEIATGFLAAPVYRMDKKIRLALHESFAGRELHLYCFAVDKDGNASMSSYAHHLPDSDQALSSPNTYLITGAQANSQSAENSVTCSASAPSAIDSVLQTEDSLPDKVAPPPLKI